MGRSDGGSMRYILFLILLGLHGPAVARPHGVSAKRPEGVSWKTMAKRSQPLLQKSLRGTAVEQAKPLPEVDFNQLSPWQDFAQIKQRFQTIRDLRFIPDPFDSQTLRRSTWLYPDDGCYARASLMKENLLDINAGEFTKIFAYGDLLVKTKNSPMGVVSWWYHVAIIVTDGNEKYILDPAIEPQKPLALKAWLSRMGDPNQIVISLCKSTTYTPYSSCESSTESDDDVALDDQIFFLSLERHRLEELGRDANEELGDRPPWML